MILGSVRPALTLVATLVVTSSLSAQSGPNTSAKYATALQVPSSSIRVDGRLDEAFWGQAPSITDFMQKEPVEGALPTERTEVRFVYDDKALYVGARMYSSGGASSIQAPLGRRDSGTLAEYVLVSLDTFLDRRTAYSFGVTAAGVRLDHFHRSDNEGNVDRGFDPVWEARVTIDDEGWTAEMWIPLSQLRYNELLEQTWGLNIQRWIPSKNESDYWVAVPRTERAWSSRFGELRGVRASNPVQRLELLPFAASGSSINGDRDLADPFDDGVNLEGRVGLDVKMGIGPNLTLDATVRPDFGQVEADPAVVSLTDFEVFFPERRPFLSEGRAAQRTRQQLLLFEAHRCSPFGIRLRGLRRCPQQQHDPRRCEADGTATLGYVDRGPGCGDRGGVCEDLRVGAGGFRRSAGGAPNHLGRRTRSAGIRGGRLDRQLHGNGRTS